MSDKDADGIGAAIGKVADDVLGTSPSTGGGFIDRIGGALRDVFTDSDGDGTPDAAESFGKLGQPKAPVEFTQVRDDARVEDFLRNVLAQVGDRYKLGAVASLKDDDPDVWDGSELVEWAANRAGVMMNDGAANQYRQLARQGGELSVEEALATPGALLYEFTGDPIGGKPTRASTAISLGDGRIVDIDPEAGVRIMDASEFTFTHGGVMPGFVDSFEPDAGAIDAVNEKLTELGIAVAESPPAPPAPPLPPLPTVADTPEIAAMAARAAHLREQLLDSIGGADRVELNDRINDLGKKWVLAKEGRDASQLQIDSERHEAQELRTQVDQLRLEADKAEAAGDLRLAEENRETADKREAVAKAYDQLIERNEADKARYEAEMLAADSQREALQAVEDQRAQLRAQAEQSIDAMEDRVRDLREANVQRAHATNLEQEAARLRADGHTAEADALAAEAAAARARADAAQESADSQVIDETSFDVLEAEAAPDARLVGSASVLDDDAIDEVDESAALHETDAATDSDPEPDSDTETEPETDIAAIADTTASTEGDSGDAPDDAPTGQLPDADEIVASIFGDDIDEAAVAPVELPDPTDAWTESEPEEPASTDWDVDQHDFGPDDGALDVDA